MTVDRYTDNFKFPIVTFDTATWHDHIHNFMDSLDALLARYISASGFVNEGVWANSTAYTVGALTVDTTDNTMWKCLVNHTSPASPTTFASSRTSNPSYWENFSVGVRSKGAWLTATAYGIGDIVTNGGNVYVCHLAHTSGTFSTDLAASKWNTLINYASQSFATITSGDALKTVRVNAAYNGFEYYTPSVGGAVAALNTISTAYIDNDAVTYAKMQNISAQYRLLGRQSSGAGDTEEITTTAFILTLLDDANAAAARSTLGIGALGTLGTINSSTLLDDDVVTLAKINNIANYRVLGNVSGGSASPSEITVYDEDDMTSNSNTGLATQQSIKAYVDTFKALVPFASATPSGASSVIIPNMTSTYDHYVIFFDLQGSADTYLDAQFSTNSDGTSPITTDYGYQIDRPNSAGASTASSSNTGGGVYLAQLEATAGNRARGVIIVTGMGTSGYPSLMVLGGTWRDGNWANGIGGGGYDTSAITAQSFLFVPFSGTVSGSVMCFAVRKSV